MQKQTESSRSDKLTSRDQQRVKMSKNFSHPDERRAFKAHGHLDILTFEDDTTIGRGVFEPGWKWSSDVKPIAGTESCEMSHTGYCVKGSMKIMMDDGKEFTLNPGDAFQIPPGHDAEVIGDETCELIDVTGFERYAKPDSRH